MLRGGAFTGCRRDALKDAVRRGEVRLLLGADAASEGLNLQRLGALVNLDLPWQPVVESPRRAESGEAPA